LNYPLNFGNHKGASAKPELSIKLIGKDVEHGYSIPIPLDSIKQIPGLEMVPMIIMAQNTIDETGRLIQKRLNHNWSWRWSSSTSVNSWMQKE
jgi:hypothetical protein